MAAVTLLNSNQTGLRVAAESSIKVLPGTPDWFPLDPNSYSDFGAEIKNLQRNPIRDDRQRAKGVSVGLNAMAGYSGDFAYPVIAPVLPSFFYAAFRKKAEFGSVANPITAVTTSTFTAASGLAIFTVGSLILFAGGSNILGNNGLKRVTTAAAGTTTVAETMVAETPPTNSTLVKVGFQTTAGDLDVSVAGPLPVVTSTAFNPVAEGITPGEWVYFGDASNALFSFSNAANNGWKRVRAVTTTSMTIDKSRLAMVAETNTIQTVRVFMGRVLKNELGTLIVRQTLQFERTLGAPDDASPTQIQSEYTTGCVGNELSLAYKPQDKLTCELSFVGCDVEYRTGVTGVKAGNRPNLVELPAYNTSDAVKRIKLSTVSSSNVAPTPLAGEVLDLKMTIKNNVKPINVVGTFGNFELVAGDFEVSADLEALFLTTAACDSVRQNADVTLDIIQVQGTQAFVLDMPLVTLGNGRVGVAKDDPIKIPFGIEANSGQQVDSNLDHTLLTCFFDYVPVIAQTLT